MQWSSPSRACGRRDRAAGIATGYRFDITGVYVLGAYAAGVAIIGRVLVLNLQSKFEFVTRSWSTLDITTPLQSVGEKRQLTLRG